jgi:hypothetical protein
LAYCSQTALIEPACKTTTRRQSIQIEAARPGLIPFQRVKLGVVAEIPNDIAGVRLLSEQSSERFDAVSIDQQHTGKLVRLIPVRNTLK